MSTHNPTATVISAQRESNGETRNGQSFRSYPPATAQFEDVVQSSDLFWEKLKAFHKSFGTKFIFEGFIHFLNYSVIRDRKWKEVIAAFNFPSTITSASFVLRKYYLSLLYHFEQVYHFHKQVPSVSIPDTVNGDFFNESAAQNEVATMNQLTGLELQLGSSVTGLIDGKFDDGYLVTVNLGFDQLKGVLYHIPNELHTSQSSHTSDLPPHRHQKRSRLLVRDHSQPKSNESGYNFFFAEHYTQLKPLYHGKRKL
ncbi:hypothetical protein GH714_017026 [Hevea brasiliensis]|uniref:ARID domain-containing protein n=1 Tax=Hevea brasiliensis TaxID=3981 RepID=A0A6A6NHY2_HEVBR|nr:hypothetical protein GH714_017026 [Hevea brasiliensis]